MPYSLRPDGQHRAGDPQDTIARVEALLERLDVDAVDSIWNDDSFAATEEPDLDPSSPSTDREADERALAAAFSNRYLLPLFDPPPDKPLPLDPAVAERLDADYCHQHRIAPLAEEGMSLEVAIAFPDALQLAADIQHRCGRQFRPLFAPQSVIDRILRVLYPSTQRNRSAANPQPMQTPRETPRAKQAAFPTADILSAEKPAEESRALRVLLAAALRRQATAVHLDPCDEQRRIRLRVAGQLVDWNGVSAGQFAELTSALHARAGLNTSDATQPRSGTFCIRKGPRRVHVRLNTCPTVDGERIVLHFQDASNEIERIEQIGLDEPQREQLRRWLARSGGCVLVSSPPGHGTTTTLYALLNEFDPGDLSVATIEASVERHLPRTHQLQVDAPGGPSFSAGLRSMLRQDIDVLMIGDLDGASLTELCHRGCATDCTVIAGWPAADPASLVQQWTRGEIVGSVPGDYLSGVLYQRLLPKLCRHCRKQQEVDRTLRQRYGISDNATLYQPTGCAHCAGRGYAGRVAVFDLLEPCSEAWNTLVSRSPQRYASLASSPSHTEGLWHSALRRVLAGETSLADAERLFHT